MSSDSNTSTSAPYDKHVVTLPSASPSGNDNARLPPAKAAAEAKQRAKAEAAEEKARAKARAAEEKARAIAEAKDLAKARIAAEEAQTFTAGGKVIISNALSPELSAEVSELTGKLLATKADNLFELRDIGLARLDGTGDALRTCPLEPVEIAHEIDTRMAFRDFFGTGDDGFYKYVHQPANVARLIFANPGRFAFRPLASISPTALLDLNGHLLNKPGYHEEFGGVYLTEGVEAFKDLPAGPIPRAVAQEAYRHFVAPMADTPFEDHRLGEAVIVAASLTPLVRPLIRDAIPGYYFAGDDRGLGKTGLAAVPSAVRTGRKPIPRTLPSSDEEVSKILVGLVQSASADDQIFDNVSIELASASLAMVMTSGYFRGRILGVNKDVHAQVPNQFVFTGVNPRSHGDFARRLLTVKLTAAKRPHNFRLADIEQHYIDHRVEFFRDLAIIFSGWIRAGRPRAKFEKAFVSYAGWEIVRHAVAWASEDWIDVVDATTKDFSATDQALYNFAGGILKLDPNGVGVGAAAIWYAATERFGKANPLLADAVGGGSTNAIGKTLSALLGTPVRFDGLDYVISGSRTKNGFVYKVVPFEREMPNATKEKAP